MRYIVTTIKQLIIQAVGYTSNVIFAVYCVVDISRHVGLLWHQVPMQLKWKLH